MIPESITPPYSHDLNQPSVPDVAPMGPTPPPSIPADHALCLIGWHPRLILVPGVLRSWETSFFPHHAAPLGFPRALPPIKSFLGGCPSVGILFFLPITWLSCLLGRFPSIISGRMFIHGKCSPRLFPLPATYPGHFATPPLFVSSCMYLFIANIFDL